MPKYRVESRDKHLAGGYWFYTRRTYHSDIIEASTPRQAAIRCAVHREWRGNEGRMRSVVVHTRRGDRAFRFHHDEMIRLQRRLGRRRRH